MTNINTKEKEKPENKKTTADKYAEHCKIDWDKCAGGDKIIDCNKRGKAKDVTGKEFHLDEPRMTE